MVICADHAQALERAQQQRAQYVGLIVGSMLRRLRQLPNAVLDVRIQDAGTSTNTPRSSSSASARSRSAGTDR